MFDKGSNKTLCVQCWHGNREDCVQGLTRERTIKTEWAQCLVREVTECAQCLIIRGVTSLCVFSV